eukprot:scaffold9778_cov72-Phaeocystis_antarctica.AAC.1
MVWGIGLRRLGCVCGRRLGTGSCVSVRQTTTLVVRGLPVRFFPSVCVSASPAYQRGARDRKPVRIAVDFCWSIGSLVDPRHFSDKNSTHAVWRHATDLCTSVTTSDPRATGGLAQRRRAPSLHIDTGHVCAARGRQEPAAGRQAHAAGCGPSRRRPAQPVGDTVVMAPEGGRAQRAWRRGYVPVLASRRGQDASDAHPRRDVPQVLVARHLHGDLRARGACRALRRAATGGVERLLHRLHPAGQRAAERTCVSPGRAHNSLPWAPAPARSMRGPPPHSPPRRWQSASLEPLVPGVARRSARARGAHRQLRG